MITIIIAIVAITVAIVAGFLIATYRVLNAR